MLDTSSWIQLFAPKVARQVVWAELVEELRHPVNSTSTSQVAEDTVSLLMAMGLTLTSRRQPSPTRLRRKQALSFGGGRGNSRLRLEARMLVLDDNRWLDLSEKQ
ncbi:LOW QUALITY PROTEIN: Eukaryotic/viral aspartic protease [Phytophthora megakarya]|uniref:Eukaryotic/viral aspartic protease n=1 Tax=Phytophthora megakarya TaxID=4795 RepID=A0A225VAA5_9STRA|nr:LOW QUALITY PROTEIN: Eukaryotic/viral aspartic protease [Phytophthora megakarya]